MVMNELGKALGVEQYTGDMDVDMDIDEGKSKFETVRKAVVKVVRSGYSATQILIQVSFLFFLFAPSIILNSLCL